MRTHWQLLETFLSTPTAPFREDQIQALVEDTLLEKEIPFFEDSYGNLVIGVSSKKAYLQLLKKKSKEPLRLFIAHMDHPGFHGAKWLSPTELEIQWHGGSPVSHLEGAKVWISADGAHGYAGSGVLKNIHLAHHGRALEKATVQFSDSTLHDHFTRNPKALFGGFQFRSPFFEENGCYYTKAADDLVGCFAILSQPKIHFKHSIGLLTRAEEVGFIGAIEHFEQGWYHKSQRKMIAVSLETSRTLPGADIGKGPVVRLGDRKTVFSPNELQVLTQLAEKILPNTPNETQHQKRVMDGGSCEATAAMTYGISAIGISVPLGNYHNQGFQGGPDCAHPEGPAPEFVHKKDIEGLLKLVRALGHSSLSWEDPWRKQRRLFQKLTQTYRPHR